MKRHATAFTLLELLVVIGIIVILALIALPNFLEAQTRSKISRARAEMATLATALEMYALDDGDYPQCDNNGWARWIIQLSTPIAYITPAHRVDPFPNFRGPITQHRHPYYYYGFNETQCLNTYQTGQLYYPSLIEPGSLRIQWWMLMSVGPDNLRNYNGAGTVVARVNLVNPAAFGSLCYDPTNGTISHGDILRPGGAIAGKSANGLKGSGVWR